MRKHDIEPLPKKNGFVTVEILDYFENHLPGEVVYMAEQEADEKLKDDKLKSKFEKITKFKPKDKDK